MLLHLDFSQEIPIYQQIRNEIVLGIASGKLGGDMVTAQGWALFGAVMPMAITGFVSAIFQGKTSVNCIYTVGKQPSLSARLILYPGMVEFYAILGLIISIMLLGQF